VQFGQYCFCGQSYGRHGRSNQCSTPCAGDNRQLCGGSWANSIYATGATAGAAGGATGGSGGGTTGGGTTGGGSTGGGPTAGNAAGFLGCYRDTSNRDLAGFQFRDARMTVGRCVSACAGKGLPYAGVQFGQYCFCGQSYGRHGRSNQCSTPCAGDNRQLCGGSWANSIYATGATGGTSAGTTASGGGTVGGGTTGQTSGGAGLFRSRWDKIAGPGGPWTTGWVEDRPYQGCPHQGTGCRCGGQNTCGDYASGDATTAWPYGCQQPPWTIRCTSVPQ